jgi:Mg-chelatase subunit ChlD
LAVGVGVACGSSGKGGYDPSAPGAGPDGDGGGGETGLGRPDEDGGPSFGTTDAQPTVDLDAACAADTQRATQVPLDLYLMLDTSGSMSEAPNGGPTKWEAVKAALTAFMADPASAGLGIGLQYFPTLKAGVPASCTSSAQCGPGAPCLLKACRSNIPFVGVNPTACDSNSQCTPFIESCQPLGQCANNHDYFCFLGGDCGNGLGQCQAMASSFCVNGDSCNAPDYAKPSVDIAALPGAASAVTASLATKSPAGSTPTSAALQGAVDQAKQHATANKDHAVVVVMATDGLPTECNADINAVSAIAGAGVSGTPSVKTFVIGVFTPEEQAQAQQNLNQIASAGGTQQAFVITTNQNVEQQFLQALTALRGSALPCEYTLPVPKSGTPDYGKVNVQYTPGSGSATTLPNVKDASACTPQGGWYYNIAPSSGTPTKVELCPATCDTVKKDSKAKVDIVQGCATFTK